MTGLTQSHHRLFAYGELLDAGHQVRLLGRRLASRPAVLRDQRRAPMPGFPYPIALPTPGGTVRGLLLDGLDDWDLRALDAWETTAHGLYRRSLVSVEVATGDAVTAVAYLGEPEAVRAWLAGAGTAHRGGGLRAPVAAG